MKYFLNFVTFALLTFTVLGMIVLLHGRIIRKLPAKNIGKRLDRE
jgi:hypothetical protein